MANTTVSTPIYSLNAPFGFNPIQVDSPVSTSGIAAGTPAGQGIATNTGPTQAVGSEVDSSIGQLVYGVATATIAVGDLVAFTQDATYGQWAATSITTATLSGIVQGLGIALAAMTVGQFGWFWQGLGVYNATVATTISANTALTTSTTAGRLATGGTAVNGLFVMDTTTANGLTRVWAVKLLTVGT